MVISPLAKNSNIRFNLTMFYNSYTSRREINTANIWRPPGKILCNIKEDSEPTVRVNLSVGSVSGVWRFVLFYFQRWWRRYTSGTRKSQTPGKLPEIVKTPGTLISRYLHICAPWFLLNAYRSCIMANGYLTLTFRFAKNLKTTVNDIPTGVYFTISNQI